MDLITKRTELLANIYTLKSYLNGTDLERDFTLRLIQRGICFVVLEESGMPFFFPSRFVGYRNNTRHEHLHNDTKGGRETNPALQAILGTAPMSSEVLEEEYEQFCAALGIEVRKVPFGIVRKFWDLRGRLG